MVRLSLIYKGITIGGKTHQWLPGTGRWKEGLSAKGKQEGIFKTMDSFVWNRGSGYTTPCSCQNQQNYTL